MGMMLCSSMPAFEKVYGSLVHAKNGPKCQCSFITPLIAPEDFHELFIVNTAYLLLRMNSDKIMHAR